MNLILFSGMPVTEMINRVRVIYVNSELCKRKKKLNNKSLLMPIVGLHLLNTSCSSKAKQLIVYNASG